MLEGRLTEEMPNDNIPKESSYKKEFLPDKLFLSTPFRLDPGICSKETMNFGDGKNHGSRSSSQDSYGKIEYDGTPKKNSELAKAFKEKNDGQHFVIKMPAEKEQICENSGKKNELPKNNKKANLLMTGTDVKKLQKNLNIFMFSPENTNEKADFQTEAGKMNSPRNILMTKAERAARYAQLYKNTNFKFGSNPPNMPNFIAK